MLQYLNIYVEIKTHVRTLKGRPNECQQCPQCISNRNFKVEMWKLAV